MLNNLIEMDVQLFDELIAGKGETRVRHDQIWLVFFDSQACKRCHEIYQVFLDLSNVPELVSVFKLAHVLCPKSMEVCHRLGVRGFPTISVLEGDRVYDYQGKMNVNNLSKFVSNKVY